MFFSNVDAPQASTTGFERAVPERTRTRVGRVALATAARRGAGESRKDPGNVRNSVLIFAEKPLISTCRSEIRWCVAWYPRGVLSIHVSA